jgi:hypothetical protein
MENLEYTNFNQINLNIIINHSKSQDTVTDLIPNKKKLNPLNFQLPTIEIPNANQP